jgi:hypothetical protein
VITILQIAIDVKRKNEKAFSAHFAMIEAAQNTRTETVQMKAIELIGDIDEQHRLRANVPEELPAGPVRLIVLLSEEDEAGTVWARGLAREWADELSDSPQDLYTLADGQLIDAAR